MNIGQNKKFFLEWAKKSPGFDRNNVEPLWQLTQRVTFYVAQLMEEAEEALKNVHSLLPEKTISKSMAKEIVDLCAHKNFLTDKNLFSAKLEILKLHLLNIIEKIRPILTMAQLHEKKDTVESILKILPFDSISLPLILMFIETREEMAAAKAVFKLNKLVDLIDCVLENLELQKFFSDFLTTRIFPPRASQMHYYPQLNLFSLVGGREDKLGARTIIFSGPKLR